MKLLVLEKISGLPAEERPREKLASRGVSGLSDAELLAMMIGSGTRSAGVEKVSSELLAFLDGRPQPWTVGELTSISGIGRAKATLILAALEFSRRRLCPARQRIGRPGDVLPLVAHFADRKQEHFLALSLNGAHEVIAVRVITMGLVNRSLVHPREVFADALMDRAAAVIVAHNHPSGNLEPSGEDREVTARLAAAGETLGVKLLDHVVFSAAGYYSFLEKGEIPS